jgi:hypothetical protein
MIIRYGTIYFLRLRPYRLRADLKFVLLFST